MRGGRRGIRTLGTFTRTTVFETATIDHSVILPSIVGELYKQTNIGGKERLALKSLQQLRMLAQISF